MPKVKQPTPQQQEAVEADKKLQAAVGNTNQEQIDRRNAIADSADAARELNEFDGEKAVAKDPTEAAAEAEARAAEVERERLEREANEAQAKALQEGGAEPAGTEPKTYKLRVNGREVEMTEAELIARASKVASADEYLQTAKEAVKRTVATEPSQDVPPGFSEDEARATLTSALQGDAEAINKIARFLTRPPQVDMRAVDDRMSFHDAVAWFRGEYQDVVKDPNLYQLVVAEDKRIAESEPALPYRTRLSRAGDTVRTWIRGYTNVKPEANPKLTRKANVAAVPAAGTRQSMASDEEPEEPVESVIDAMAKSRGQGQAIRTPQGLFGKS